MPELAGLAGLIDQEFLMEWNAATDRIAILSDSTGQLGD
jgi:hypothetical protein